MKQVVIVALALILAFGALWYLGTRPAQGQSVVQLGQLTQISNREFVDLSKLSYVILPVYTPDDPSCSPNCQRRWGATMVVDGKEETFTEDAEKWFRERLGAK
jgi:hypothetical protein